MSKILFLDLDRTLFDTSLFMENVWHVLEKEFNLSFDQGRGAIGAFYSERVGLNHYDFFKHLESVHLDEKIAMSYLLTHVLGQFVFNDVRQTISKLISLYDCRILTFGDVPFQQFKLQFCPELQKLPVIVVDIPKPLYLEQNHPSDDGWLVDDKDLHGTLPEHFSYIQIDRSAHEPYSVKNKKIIINSFEFLKEVL